MSTKTKKVVAFVMAVAFVFSYSIAAADTVMTSTTTTTTTGSYVFTRSLTIGSTGADVSALQTVLVARGFLVMPAGVAMGYFGALTRSALASFQASVGISPAAGYFGPITMAYMNAQVVAPSNPSTVPGCTSTAGFSPTTGAPCNGGSSSTGNNNDNTLSGGETSINNFDLSDADDDTVNEGSTKVEVAQVEFDVDDADAQLDRADIIFDGSSNTSGGEDQPWKVFDHVYLMNGSDVIADMDSGSKSDWDETNDNDVYRIRMSDIGEVFNEDETPNLTVAVDVADSVDEAGTDADWDVYVATNEGDDDGFRFTDSAGIDTFVGEGTNEAAFSIVEAGTDSDFDVSESDDSPDADTLEVDETSTTELTLGVFTMSADEDGGDVMLDDFPVKVVINNTGGSTFADVIDDVYVEIDGTKYKADFDTASSCGATLAACTDGETATFRFDDIEDDEIVVNAGDDMDATVSIKFKSQGAGASNYDNNTSVKVSSFVQTSDVEDADSGDDVGSVSGSADADTFTLASTGLGVELISTDSDTSGDNDTVGEYTFVVDVTAFGDDQFVELSGTRGTVETNTGFNYLILNGTNGTYTTGTTTISVDADEDEDTPGNNRVKINENETVRFTVQVFFDADASASYKAQLYSVNFAGTDIDANQQQVLNPFSTYRTTSQQVNAS